MTPAGKLRAGHALFPGSFDPVTLGHQDVLERGARLFERLTVAVARHPSKHELLPLDQRLELLQDVAANLPGVAVVHLEGLVVHGCRDHGCGVILRGVRSASDLDYELAMARTNRALLPEVETVLLASSPEHAHISSTLVRQVAQMGGALEPFVPPAVVRALRTRFPSR
jgi:pantetheine-phosphate adenylyltransferase